MNSLPLVPRNTVVFFPKSMKVKTSPYCIAHQPSCAARPFGGPDPANLFPTTEEEFIGIDAVGNGAPDERYPVEHNWRFLGISNEQLAQDVEDDDKDEGSG